MQLPTARVFMREATGRYFSLDGRMWRTLAAHQSALALLAGEGPDHRFVRKYALFTRGRWPLGYHSARFAIF